MGPFRCHAWSCPICGPEHAKLVRRGIYEAVAQLGLKDMLTLTLPLGARGENPVESRTAASVMFNAFRTVLRERG